MKIPGTVQGFRALQLKFIEDSRPLHYIYFKEHAVRERSEDKPSGRTLFVLNIPPYINSEGIKRAFSSAGKITTVIFNIKPLSSEITEPDTKDYFARKHIPTFRIAYVVFEKVSELDEALKLKNLTSVYTSKNKPKFGISKWVDEYNNAVPFTNALKDVIYHFMKQHDEKTEKAEEREKELQQADNGGWVTVTRKGNVSSFSRTEKVENKIMEKEAFGKKKKELKNFYTFQIRESKMKHIVALRHKFEEDKKKIAQIKQSRRFKPF